jgi:hypothetical protein
MPWGDISVLTAVRLGKRYLVDYSSTGELKLRREIQCPSGDPAQWRVQDFALDREENVYFLETCLERGATRNWLRKLSPAGQVSWGRQGGFSAEQDDLDTLSGDFRQLLVDGAGIAYLAATRNGRLVARIDSVAGTMNRFAVLPREVGDVWMDSLGSLYYVRYLPKEAKRAWIKYLPATAREEITVGEDEAYSFLGSPIGVDAAGRAYATSGRTLGCLANGSMSLLRTFDNVVVDEAERIVFESRFHEQGGRGQVVVTAWTERKADERQIVLEVPEDLIRVGGSLWYLLYRDDAGNFQVFGSETDTRRGILISYSADGRLIQQTNPAPDIHLKESQLQAPRSWQIDPQGNVYLPVLDPSGIHVVKLTRQALPRHQVSST